MRKDKKKGEIFFFIILYDNQILFFSLLNLTLCHLALSHNGSAF